MKGYGLLLTLLLAMAQVGCASIMSGTSQEIWVGSSPPGAVVSIDYSTGAAYSVDPDQFAVRLIEIGAERREADRAAKVPAAQPVRRPEDEVPE